MTERPVAIVTAAGSGIGAACARERAERGYRLALMSRSDGAARVAAEIGADAMQGSVTDPGDLERLVQMALDAHGRIDAVVNNTGHAPHSTNPTGRGYDPDAGGNLLDIPDEDWHLTLDLYMLNVVRMARLVTPHMQRQGGGAMVNISAFAVPEPHAAYPTSSTIRAALAGFTKLYAERYAADGIRMNGVLPGFLDNHEWDGSLIRSIPMARPGALAEIAKTVAFLLSPDAGYITGQGIVADGGMNRGV